LKLRSQLRGKPKAWIEVWVAENDNDPVPLLFANFQATAYQGRADALVLALRQHSHWRERQGRNNPGVGDDGQVAEKDVADDLFTLLGHQRYLAVPAIPKGVYQPGLRILTESKLIDLSDGLVIDSGFLSNQGIHSRGPSVLLSNP
jgi:hypothetical protein